MAMFRLLRPILLGTVGKRFLIENIGGRREMMTKYYSILAHDASKSAFNKDSSSTSATIDDFLTKHEITIDGNRSTSSAVDGGGDLRPILNFDDANFPDSVIGALKSKFDTPSVIQSISWPYVLAERDLVGIARTGSGKTLSFLLPALVHIARQDPLKRGDGPIVLILCPTRELAQQVQTVADEWSRLLARVRTVCVFGGANRVPQEIKLQGGVEIVVATPGRLNDFLQNGATKMNRCSYLVLDEADRMLDMGFEPQIRQIIDQMKSRPRQTVMYSATWPKEVRTLAADFMKNYVQVKIGTAELAANKNIKQNVHVTTKMERAGKFWKLLQELLQRDPNGKILVFCQQKVWADALENQARNKRMKARAIHGDKSQGMRDQTLEDFRSGRTQILFATDVAARGLDVDDIKCVINYDHPPCVEDYVHRIGRTARRDRSGESHTFLVEEDAGERAKDLIKVLKASDQSVSDELTRLAESFTGRESTRRWGSYGSGNRQFDRTSASYRFERRPSYSADRSPRQDRYSSSRYDRFDYGESGAQERSRSSYGESSGQDRPRSSYGGGSSRYDTRGGDDRRMDSNRGWSTRNVNERRTNEEIDDFDFYETKGSGRK